MPNFIHFDIERIVKETDKAFLLRADEGEFWVPKSMIADVDDYQEGAADCCISISEWWCEQNDLA